MHVLAHVKGVILRICHPLLDIFSAMRTWLRCLKCQRRCGRRILRILCRRFSITRTDFDLRTMSTISDLDGGEENYLVSDGIGIPPREISDCIKVYKGCNINYPYYLSLPDLERFQASSKDVAICGFPKSGSAWISAIVYMIQHDASPAALSEGPPLDEKVPYLEFCTPANYAGYRVVDALNELPASAGRTFFTHLSFGALPPSLSAHKSKIVYHVRNPKDVIVSTYFHLKSRRRSAFAGDLNAMVDAFLNDRICYGPYFDHLASYWNHVEDPNMLMISFEELSENFTEVVERIAKFLGKELTEQQLYTIAHHCSFGQMKKNDLTNRVASHRKGVLDFQVSPFLRAGSVGNWKEHFSTEMDIQVDKWITDNLKRPDLIGINLVFE